jgi:hypothetical protein
MGKKSKSKEDRRSHKEESIPADDYDDSERFDSSKPQFRAPKGETSKVVLDDRFSSVLTDSRFQLDAKDKYGRKKKKKHQVKDELSAFYTIEDGKGEEKPDADDAEKADDNDQNESDSSSESDKDEKDSDDAEEEEDPRSRIDYLTALSRGEVDVSSSSEDEDDQSQSSSDDDSSDGEDPVHGRAGVLDPSSRTDDGVELTFDESPYLAVMHMDWAHVRAVDIFAIVSSFTPHGAVRKVQVFPSDFGMEQQKKDEQMGPAGLWRKPKPTEEEEDSEDEASAQESADEGSNGSKDVSDDAPDLDPDGEDDDSTPDVGGLQNNHVESDFDPEKLRAYEASKLKYYFAIIELASPQHADIAYKEVDGMEFERSGAAVDMRSIPPSSLADVVKDRKLRDEATSIPSNYVPPEFVVSALQQTKVQCTWETGDHERERTLTKYSSGEGWAAMTETDDLKAYLASEGSSDEEDIEEGEATQKGANLRKMLGLDSDSDDASNDSTDEESSSDDEVECEGLDDEFAKEIKFMPGKNVLQDKIRSKLGSRDVQEEKELTPWEKYQEKRKEKKRLKRGEMRAKRKEVNNIRKGVKETDRPARKSKQDDFFVDSDADSSNEEQDQLVSSKEKSKEELELLVAGADGDEEAKDYDMRGLQRIDKNKDKKLRGSRKRREEAAVASVSGTDFKLDTGDIRFAAVLEGSDDRFGIDRTDPNFKETTAMREILAEQTRQRKSKRRKKNSGPKVISDVSADHVVADTTHTTSGASALSSLVKSLKSNVSKTS